MFKRNNEKYELTLKYDMILDPPNIKYTKALDKEKINSMEFGSVILDFYKALITLRDVDLSYLYLNIETLETRNIGSLLKEGTRAGYSVRYNSIAFKDYFNTDEIYHELLHLSSSMFDREKLCEFCGFSQYNYITNIKIGTALNEGYTEYLNEKLFNNKSNVYIIEQNFAKAVEQIVDPVVMKKFFFKANLKELLDILSIYSSMDKTLEFIELIDYISSNSNKIFTKEKLEKKIYDIVNIIIEYLINTYLTKLNIDLNNSSISKDEYDENIEKFINNLGSFNYYSENKSYPMRFISKRKVLKIYKKIIKK